VATGKVVADESDDTGGGDIGDFCVAPMARPPISMVPVASLKAKPTGLF
jgi:hypothetical protein